MITLRVGRCREDKLVSEPRDKRPTPVFSWGFEVMARNVPRRAGEETSRGLSCLATVP